MTTLVELVEQAAAGELDHADVAAFSAEVATVVTEQLAQSTDPGTAPLRAMMVRAQVADAQAKVSALLQEADLIEHEAKLETAVTVARAQLQAAEQVAAQAHERIVPLADEARLTAADAQGAADYAVKMRKADADLRMLGASAQQRTDAKLRADAADEIARQATETAARAAQAHQEAARNAEMADGLVRGAQGALRAAETAHAAAGETVRPSAITLALDWPRLLGKGELKGEEIGVVRGFVQAYAAATGADQDTKLRAEREAHKRVQDELYNKLVRVPTAGEALDRAADVIHHPGDGGPFANW